MTEKDEEKNIEQTSTDEVEKMATQESEMNLGSDAAPESDPAVDNASESDEPEDGDQPVQEPEAEPLKAPDSDDVARMAVDNDKLELDHQAGLRMDAAFDEEVKKAAEKVAADAAQAAQELMQAELEKEVEQEPEILPEEPDDERLWYVVHCYSGYENKVRHNLEQRIESMGMKDRIFDVVVPTEEEIEVKNGKRRTVERRVFPGYILVQMILTEESWYVVRNTPGVTGFVGMGNDPTPLRPEEVALIIKRMEAEAPRIKVTYAVGQKVRIIDGPFNDFIGTVDDIDMERAKVRVMVSFFGRETPVELDFLQVEKA